MFLRLRSRLLAVFLGMSVLALVALGAVVYHNAMLERASKKYARVVDEQFQLEFYLANLQRLSYGLFVQAAGEDGHGRSALQLARRNLDLFESRVAATDWDEAVLEREELEYAILLRAELGQQVKSASELIDAVRELPENAAPEARRQAHEALHAALTRAVATADSADLFVTRTFEKLSDNERQRTAASEALIQRVNVVTFGLSALVLIVAICAGLLLARSLVRRIVGLEKAARAFGSGDFSARALTTGRIRHDELDQLAVAFNRMAEDLQENTGLKLSKEYVDSIIHSMTNGLLVLDDEFCIERSNRAATAILGYDDDELVDRSATVIAVERTLVESDAELSVDAVSWLSGEVVTGHECQLRHRDGHPIPVLLSLAPMSDYRHGRKYVCVFEDMSERQQLIADLRHSRDAAESATRAKSAFLASMSHELRTPLNSILGFSQVLLADDGIATRERDALVTMRASGEHLLTLLDDLLDISRIEAGRLDIHEDDFSLPTVMTNLAAMFRASARDKGLHFLYEELSELPHTVRGDPRRLRQVLINLLSNAIKYTEQGGVVFRVGAHHGGYRFQVEDTGVGVPADQLDSIFEPFLQAADGRRRSDGAGLGLAISKRLVELMGGRLGVSSTVGEGSKFWVDIELAMVMGGESERTRRRVIGYKGPRRTVLIVDDRDENREVLRALLGPLGFELREASNGREAVDAAVWKKPDLILMDVRMPEMDGLEATRQLRQIGATSEIRIIAVSASAFDEDQEACLSAGCDGFLSKPVRLDRLLDVLAEFLEIEWDYVKSEITESPSARTALADTVVPAAVLARLDDLARRGDIKSLRAMAEELPAEDEGLRPLADRLVELTRGYRIKQIRELLQGLASARTETS